MIEMFTAQWLMKACHCETMKISMQGLNNPEIIYAKDMNL